MLARGTISASQPRQVRKEKGTEKRKDILMSRLILWECVLVPLWRSMSAIPGCSSPRETGRVSVSVGATGTPQGGMALTDCFNPILLAL